MYWTDLLIQLSDGNHVLGVVTSILLLKVLDVVLGLDTGALGLGGKPNASLRVDRSKVQSQNAGMNGLGEESPLGLTILA